MKISYRTNSAIKIIEEGNFKNCLVNPNDMEVIQKMGIEKEFKKNAHNFKDIKIITQPFFEAMEKSVQKIWQSDLLNGHYSDFGTFVFKSNGIVNTYCYNFTVENRVFTRLILFYFQGSLLIKYTDSVHDYINSELPKDSNSSSIKSLLPWVFEFYFFTKFCKTEVKILKPGQKDVEINCKYKNDTFSNIKILDSTWFTTLVKSDAFKVRGHFRLQPKKINGQWTKELIWINDFVKDGYTAPARKLKEAD